MKKGQEDVLAKNIKKLILWMETHEKMMAELNRLFILLESRNVADEGTYKHAFSEQIKKIKALHKALQTTL